MSVVHSRVSVLVALLAFASPSARVGYAAEPSTTPLASPAASVPVHAPRGTVDVGSTGANGVFNPTSNVTIDLATQGTYDPQRWMVIFHYQSVNIPSNVTVNFTNHPSRAPVVWLVQGNVTIAGSVRLDGAFGHEGHQPPRYAEPGPGGFRGGRGSLDGLEDDPSPGLGPGGGFRNLGGTNAGGGHGGYSTPGAVGWNSGGAGGSAYGDHSVKQLVGGSGGAGGRHVANGADVSGGGAGGGAILIAANGTITVTNTGLITAYGGRWGGGQSSNGIGGYGSGGTIKLVADSVLLQRGGNGARLNALPWDPGTGAK